MRGTEFSVADSAVAVGAGLLVPDILIHKSGASEEVQPNWTRILQVIVNLRLP
jgi:hypothetical protein